MINEQIVGYVASERARGVPDHAISGALLLQGWKEDDVQSAMRGGNTASAVAIVEMGIFDLLSASWATMMSRFRMYAILALLPISANMLTFLLIGGGAMSLSNGYYMMAGMMGGAIVSILITFVASLMASASLIIALSDTTIVSPQEAITRAMSFIVRYALMSIVLAIIIGIGFLLLLIPGIYLLGKYGLASIVVVAENKGVDDALSASSAYTNGRVWSVAWKLIAGTILISIVMGILASIITAMLSFALPMLSVFASIVINTAMTLFMVIYLFLCYKNISGRTL
jgi:hypothetical protein